MGVLTQLVKSNTQRPPIGRQTGLLGAGSQRGSTVGQAMDAYATSGWVFSIIGRITNSVAQVDWDELVETKAATPRTRRLLAQAGKGGLFTGAPTRGSRVAASTLSHKRLKDLIASGQLESAPTMSRAMQLWNNPNPFFSEHELVECIQQHLELVGEGWLVIVRGDDGEPAELWVVRPDRMKPVPDRDQFIRGYLYTAGTEKIPLDVEDVIFLRVPSPTDVYRGMGPVQAILFDLDADKFAAQWNRNFFTNNAEPGGTIEVPDGLSDVEWDRLKTQWNQEHLGVSNTGRVAILEHAHWVDRKYSHEDMSFIDGRKWARDTILGAWGMPGSTIGIAENVNRANAMAAEVLLDRHIVVPRLDRIKMALNGRLWPMFADSAGRVVTYIDPTPEDETQRLMEATVAYKAGLYTKDEGRAVLGKPPVEDGTGGEFFKPPAPVAFSSPGVPEEPGTPSTGEPTSADGKAKAAPSTWPQPLQDLDETMARNWEKRLAGEADSAIEMLRTQWREERGVDSDFLVAAMLAGVGD